MKLTGEKLASVLETLASMNKLACGRTGISSIVFECLARDDETRKRGAKAFGELAERLIVAGRLEVLASVVRDLDDVRKKRKKGESMPPDDPIVRMTGEDHHKLVPIRKQDLKTLTVICIIENSLKKDGTLPSAEAVRDRLPDGLISRRMIYTVFEKVSAATGLRWSDQRERWVWPDKCNGD